MTASIEIEMGYVTLTTPLLGCFVIRQSTYVQNLTIHRCCCVHQNLNGSCDLTTPFDGDS